VRAEVRQQQGTNGAAGNAMAAADAANALTGQAAQDGMREMAEKFRASGGEIYVPTKS
jgi:hypothetical protein